MNQAEAKELFDYVDGELIWKKNQRNGIQAGKIAGNVNNIGYKKTSYKGVHYLMHRLIFLYHHGYMPEIIDHIDINKLNNRIENLRAATQSQNCLNIKMRSTNITGVRNVSLCKRSKKYYVSLCINKKTVNFGSYKDLTEATNVAIQAREKYYGNFYKEHHA
jgi:hypothetical protein